MKQSKMDVFQTYKALALKVSWQRDLEMLEQLEHSTKYKRCLPWGSFLKIMIVLEVIIVLTHTILYFRDYDLFMLPLVLLVGMIVALQPLLIIVTPFAIYNFIKIKYNRHSYKNKATFKRITKQQAMCQTNLATIQKSLAHHSVVPVQFQTENALQEMMTDIKKSIATSDSHAVYLHAERVRMNQRQQDVTEHVESHGGNGFENFIKGLLMYALLKDLFRSKNQ